MDWQPAFAALRDALAETFGTIGVRSTTVQDRFVSLAGKIIQLCGSEIAESGWHTVFQSLCSCLEQDFPRISYDHPGAGREICRDFESLVREVGKAAFEIAGNQWFRISAPWRKARVLAEEMANRAQVQFGDPNLQNVFYFSADKRFGYVRFLHQMWSKHRNEPDLGPTLKRAIFEESFAIRLESILSAPEDKRVSLCQRLRNRAHFNQDGTPTLTAGLRCLLNPSHAQEQIALLMNDPRAQRDGIPETVVLWFGESAVVLFQYLIEQTHDSMAKARWVGTLGMIGGYNAVEVLCGQLWVESVRETVLSVIERLASTTTAAVYLLDEPPDSRIEDTIKLVLGNLAVLKRSKTVSHQRISQVERKVREYHGLPEA